LPHSRHKATPSWHPVHTTPPAFFLFFLELSFFLSLWSTVVQDVAKAAFHGRFASTVEKFPEVSNYLARALDDLNPACVLRIFQKVPDADVSLLGLATRPEHLLIVSLAAPPVCIRPSVEMDVGAASNEDDATARLLAVCDMSVSIRKNLDAGIACWETIMEQWDFLQVWLVSCFSLTDVESSMAGDL
jgi:DNA-directed RNA polymerase beta' subunit